MDKSEIVHEARAIVLENKLQDIVQIIHGGIEEVQLPVDRVDVIISEWMGYFLLFESMLDSVLFARDKYLVPGGLLVPDQAGMWLAGVDESIRAPITYWDDVYGFKMSCMKQQVLAEADICRVPVESILTSRASLKQVVLAAVQRSDLEFDAEFTLVAQRSATLAVGWG